MKRFNPLTAELNPICHLLALLGGATIVVDSRLRVNLLGSSSSNSAGVSSLGCVVSFSRYLMLKLVISALTVGICRSVCRSVFGTYHGELTIDLKTLFSNCCSISMLELLAVPKRGMPYVQIGFRIVL